MATFTKTGKFGALTTYQVAGSASELQALLAVVKNITTYPSKITKGAISGRGSKRDVANIVDAVNSFVAPTVQTTKKSSGGRSIELASNANNLNHGKSWVCSGIDVDKHSLNPSWEGEKICYIYN